jgi:Na+/H+-dicarboxylate symporter
MPDLLNSPINEAVVDRFTLLHVLSGAGSRLIGASLVTATVGSLVFEVVENVLQPQITSVFPNTADRDSPMNSACDTLAVMIGWAVADWVTATTKRGRVSRALRGTARRRT